MARIDGARPSRLGLFHGLLTRVLYFMVKRRLGHVVMPVQIAARHAKLLWGYSQMELAFDKSRLVEGAVKNLAQLRVATLVGCPF